MRAACRAARDAGVGLLCGVAVLLGLGVGLVQAEDVERLANSGPEMLHCAEPEALPALEPARSLARDLGLRSLPEAPGTYFREVFRSPCTTTVARGERHCASVILYLVPGGATDPWHASASDELFTHAGGTGLRQLLLKPDGAWEERVIGDDLAAGERPQSHVPAGTWMAMTLADTAPEAWGLFHVLVSPGFDYRDLNQANGTDLAKKWPAAAPRMRELGLLE